MMNKEKVMEIIDNASLEDLAERFKNSSAYEEYAEDVKGGSEDTEKGIGAALMLGQ